MRSLLTATLIFVAIEASAQAQMTAPVTLGSKPKAVATTTVRPPAQMPADTANAMTQDERLTLQSDLAWVGQYNGTISGDASNRMVNAVKEFQRQRGDEPTGVLAPEQRIVLSDTAKRRQANVGWKIVTDAGTGTQLGIPAKLVPQESGDANGAKWSSANGRHPDPADPPQGGPSDHRQARGAREEQSAGTDDRLYRDQAGFLRAVGHARPQEVLRSRWLQGR